VVWIISQLYFYLHHSGNRRRLPKIKAWIDTHNPGDPLIPFSVSLEQRLADMSSEEQEAEQKSIGAQSALGKITQAGYSSLDVRSIRSFFSAPQPFQYLSTNFLVDPIFHLWSG
jgi:ribosome-binding ATPase YchF (GTP1/OBG family)